MMLSQRPYARVLRHNPAEITCSNRTLAPVRQCGWCRSFSKNHGSVGQLAASETAAPTTVPRGLASLLAATCTAQLMSAMTGAGPALAADWADMHPGFTQQQQLQQQPLQQREQQFALAHHVLSLPAAPATSGPEQQQHGWQALQQLAAVGEPRPRFHWLVNLLWIGVLNALGLWAVMKVLAWSKDLSTPVSVLRIHVGFRVDGQQLQERLRFVRSTMMPVQHGQFFTFEEVVQLICRPPRGTHIAYADFTATSLGSKQKGYDLFKQFAAVEQVAAEAEEQNLLTAQKPEDCKIPQRSPLQRLLGVAEADSADECQACVVVSLVVLALGHISVPDMVTRDKHFFRTCMRELSAHLSTGQLLAVELLITPDDPADFLSESQLMQDYPFMTDLSTGQLISEPYVAPRGAAQPGAAADAVGSGGLGAATPISGASGAAATAAVAADM